MASLDLFPYQEEGARFLAARTRAGLFDEPGVGKSAQVIRSWDLIGAMKILVVCPAAVRQVWIGEHKKFSRTHRRIAKGRDIQDLNMWLRGKLHVLVVSYEMAEKWARRMEGDLIDAIVFDESHYLKNAGSKRTRAMLGHDCSGAYGLAKWAAYVVFATGTPNSNDAADIWSVMRFCRATTLGQRIFRDRYYRPANAFGTLHKTRDDTLHELRAAIQGFSLTRTKRQANLQLPPIWLTTVDVDGDTAEVAALLRQFPDMEKAILAAIDKGGLSFLDAQHIMTLRRLVAEAKAPSYAEMLVEEMNDGAGKRVVFGIHTAALRRIHERLRAAGVGVVRFDGETSDRERSRSVEAFQRDPDVRVFLANIRAAGTGLTLTAGADVDMFESEWAPAANAQAIMRVHRIGQDKAVTARFITLANSIDEMVSDRIALKTAAIAKVGTGGVLIGA